MYVYWYRTFWIWAVVSGQHGNQKHADCMVYNWCPFIHKQWQELGLKIAIPKQIHKSYSRLRFSCLECTALHSSILWKQNLWKKNACEDASFLGQTGEQRWQMAHPLSHSPIESMWKTSYRNAYNSSNMIHTAMTPPMIRVSLLFRMFILCIRLFKTGKRSVYIWSRWKMGRF